MCQVLIKYLSPDPIKIVRDYLALPAKDYKKLQQELFLPKIRQLGKFKNKKGKGGIRNIGSFRNYSESLKIGIEFWQGDREIIALDHDVFFYLIKSDKLLTNCVQHAGQSFQGRDWLRHVQRVRELFHGLRIVEVMVLAKLIRT